jgi:hypothetical protein
VHKYLKTSSNHRQTKILFWVWEVTLGGSVGRSDGI